ncbi:MAG TPA: HAMP domain-containing sensor histidine kinase [Solirubrobacterales bacterium]|nr:HAMP domain-containing sensor histidine kinase [Solirubrobacterales bacterium]
MRRSRKWPPHWPIQWKLAAVSAGITFVILVAFGLAVGQITTNQLRDNYAADTEAKANELAAEIRRRNLVACLVTPGYIGDASGLSNLLASVNGAADVTTLANKTRFQLPNTHDLGDPSTTSGISTYDGWQVATAVVYQSEDIPTPVALVRFGRPMERLDASVGRIWISILAGALGATLLAALGGVILSRRAMRPISTLTSAAGQIARTRDPDVTLAEPEGDDEVAELTRTFNDMLHELSIARVEREQSLKRQREFVADASHELRTPLTSVLANLELLDTSLRRPGSGNGDRDFEIESVESALRSSERMTRLVADLQLLAKADSERYRDLVPCDLSEIAANVAAELRPLSDNHTIALDTPEAAVVEGNGDDLHRVILNLIDNAIRHTPAGSTITVTTRLDRDIAEIRVEDDGPGVPKEMWPTIFDRFVRHDGRGDRKKGKGTGLGLAIVRVIARSHGGSARVGTSPEGGASFVVRIPAIKPAEKTPETASEKPQGNR